MVEVESEVLYHWSLNSFWGRDQVDVTVGGQGRQEQGGKEGPGSGFWAWLSRVLCFDPRIRPSRRVDSGPVRFNPLTQVRIGCNDLTGSHSGAPGLGMCTFKVWLVHTDKY